MKDDQKQLISVIQTIIIVVIAIPLGVLPLVRQLFSFGPGRLFDWVFREPTDNAAWIIPVAVIILSGIVVIAIEELPKRRTE